MRVYKEDIEESKRRVDAWWNHEIIDRAVIQVRAPRDVPLPREPAGEESEPDSAEEWFTDPQRVIPRMKRQFAGAYFGGEAFPVMFPVAIQMVAITAAYLGCPLEFLNGRTVWSHPILSDWDDRPAFHFDPDNRIWQASERLLKAAVEQADGYYVGLPDLNGPTEILARLRGPEPLALDFYERPQYIKPALAEINQAWHRCWKGCADIANQAGGYFCWMGMWSDRPMTDLQSDFSCMMSKEMFDEFFLPFIAEQTEMVERTIYHLDGPGAVKHLDSLLDLPRLTGIQWVPGAGAAPAVEWIPLLKRIQDAGKLVYTDCDATQVQTLLSELRPEGLMLAVHGCGSEDEVRKLLANVAKWSRKA